MGATVEDGGLLMQEVWVTQTKDDDVGVASPLEEVKVVVGRWVAPPLVVVWGGWWCPRKR